MMKIYSTTVAWLFALLLLQPVSQKHDESGTARDLKATVEKPTGAAVNEDEKVRHEFYVGLTDIVYNPSSRTYEITVKVFTDDLELALGSANGGKAVTLADYGSEADNDTLIFAYMAGRFRFSRKGNQTTTIHPIGRETELDVTWIYLETEPMQPLKEAFVSNTMMMEIYDDQTHIVHLKQAGDTKTLMLHNGKQSGTLKL
jgi:hypothetical protein